MRYILFSLILFFIIPVAHADDANPSGQCFTRQECENQYKYKSTLKTEEGYNYKPYISKSNFIDRVWKENTVCGAGAGFCSAPAPIVKLSVPLPYLVGDSVQGLDQYISLLYQGGVYLASIFAVFLIIIAGYQWLFAGGSPAQITKAKMTMKRAISGLTLLIFSYILLKAINPDLVSLKFQGAPLVRTKGIGGSVCKPVEGKERLTVKDSSGKTIQIASTGVIFSVDGSAVENKYAYCGEEFLPVEKVDQSILGPRCVGDYCPFKFSCSVGTCSAVIASGKFTIENGFKGRLESIRLYRVMKGSDGTERSEEVGMSILAPGQTSFSMEPSGKWNSIPNQNIYNGISQDRVIISANVSDSAPPERTRYYFIIVINSNDPNTARRFKYWLVNKECQVITTDKPFLFKKELSYTEALFGIKKNPSDTQYGPSASILPKFSGWPIINLKCNLDNAHFAEVNGSATPPPATGADEQYIGL